MKSTPQRPNSAVIYDAANLFAEGLANWREIIAPLDEATAGYRAQLESNGWSPAAAEQMAIGFYSLQISMLTQHVNQAIATQDDTA